MLIKSIAGSLIVIALSGLCANCQELQAPYVRYVKTPKPLVKVRGEYSEEALLAELEGTVTVAATIAVDGSVRDSRVIGRLGIGLDEMARAAAERWSFEPGETESGKAPMLAIMDLEFLLPLKQSRWHLLGLSFNTPQCAS